MTAPAHALLVNNFTPFPEDDPNPNSNVVNTTAPPGDRGFSNLPTNLSGVYLGDHWVLTALHAIPGDQGAAIDIAGDRFPLIPNSARRLNTGTSGSDLLLWRVGVNDQGQSPEDISSQLRDNLQLNAETGKLELPVADQLVGRGEDLTIFGRGRSRILNPVPQVEDGMVVSQHSFFSTTGQRFNEPVPGGFSGFRIASSPAGVWQWGENRRATNPSTITTNQVTPTITFTTRFDENGGPNEAQGAGGDSGGPVFRQNASGDYELVGLLHAVGGPPGGSGNALAGAFGASTFISDLSNSSYESQIEALRAETEYSVLGDINLDGSVDAALVGDTATGDLGILVDNWQRTFETANIQSWIAGDLNQDAIVDLADFALLRAATGGGVSVAQLQTALLSTSLAIPEPTSLALITMGLLASAGRRRR